MSLNNTVMANMTKPLIFVAGMTLGIVSAGTAAYVYGGQFIMWGMYMDAVADAKANVAVLKELDEGNTEIAKKYLKKFLETDEAILRGCKNDLCSKKSFPEVQDTLREVQNYHESQINTHP